MTRSLTLVALIAIATAGDGGNPVAPVAIQGPFGAKPWMQRGPTNLSGLVTALLLDPDDPNRYVAGTPAGIWITTDGGASWFAVPSTDTINVDCLALDPVHHDTL